MPSKHLRNMLTRLSKPKRERDIQNGEKIEINIDNAMLMQKRDWVRLKERGAKRIIVMR